MDELHDDVVRDVVERLSLSDLVSLSRTCRRLRRLANPDGALLKVPWKRESNNGTFVVVGSRPLVPETFSISESLEGLGRRHIFAGMSSKVTFLLRSGPRASRFKIKAGEDHYMTFNEDGRWFAQSISREYERTYTFDNREMTLSIREGSSKRRWRVGPDTPIRRTEFGFVCDPSSVKRRRASTSEDDFQPAYRTLSVYLFDPPSTSCFETQTKVGTRRTILTTDRPSFRRVSYLLDWRSCDDDEVYGKLRFSEEHGRLLEIRVLLTEINGVRGGSRLSDLLYCGACPDRRCVHFANLEKPFEVAFGDRNVADVRRIDGSVRVRVAWTDDAGRDHVEETAWTVSS